MSTSKLPGQHHQDPNCTRASGFEAQPTPEEYITPKIPAPSSSFPGSILGFQVHSAIKVEQPDLLKLFAELELQV